MDDILANIFRVNDPHEPAAGPLMRSVAARVCWQWHDVAIEVGAQQSQFPDFYLGTYTGHMIKVCEYVCKSADVHLHARLGARGWYVNKSFLSVCKADSPLLIRACWERIRINPNAYEDIVRPAFAAACERGYINTIRTLIDLFGESNKAWIKNIIGLAQFAVTHDHGDLLLSVLIIEWSRGWTLAILEDYSASWQNTIIINWLLQVLKAPIDWWEQGNRHKLMVQRT